MVCNTYHSGWGGTHPIGERTNKILAAFYIYKQTNCNDFFKDYKLCTSITNKTVNFLRNLFSYIKQLTIFEDINLKISFDFIATGIAEC